MKLTYATSSQLRIRKSAQSPDESLHLNEPANASTGKVVFAKGSIEPTRSSKLGA
jgi:hypothetical protein